MLLSTENIHRREAPPRNPNIEPRAVDLRLTRRENNHNVRVLRELFDDESKLRGRDAEFLAEVRAGGVACELAVTARRISKHVSLVFRTSIQA